MNADVNEVAIGEHHLKRINTPVSPFDGCPIHSVSFGSPCLETGFQGQFQGFRNRTQRRDVFCFCPAPGARGVTLLPYREPNHPGHLAVLLIGEMARVVWFAVWRSEEHTSELQSLAYLV